MGYKKPARVLIADDDFLNCELCRHLLDQIGHHVAGMAHNGRQAVDLTLSLRPDAILMDVSMPECDGLEAAAQIQRLCPTPIVVLTAYESPHLVEKACVHGAGAYVLKPPDAPEIERAITIAMARFSDMTELWRLNRELQARTKALEEALSKVRVLSGLIPICASCKKVRDDHGYWKEVEAFIEHHSDAVFSHGICPVCARARYPEFFAGPH